MLILLIFRRKYIIVCTNHVWTLKQFKNDETLIDTGAPTGNISERNIMKSNTDGENILFFEVLFIYYLFFKFGRSGQMSLFSTLSSGRPVDSRFFGSHTPNIICYHFLLSAYISIADK